MATRNQVLKLFDKEERFTPIDELLLHLESPSMVSDAGIIGKELLQTYNALIARLTPSQQVILECGLKKTCPQWRLRKEWKFLAKPYKTN